MFPNLQDNLKLMDDLAALRPTIFSSVPRLYNRIYAGYISSVLRNDFFELLWSSVKVFLFSILFLFFCFLQNN